MVVQKLSVWYGMIFNVNKLEMHTNCATANTREVRRLTARRTHRLYNPLT